METLVGALSALDKKVPINWILLIFMAFIAYKMISIDNRMDRSIGLIQKDIGHIQKDLGNHIGDTNKKIDRLSEDFRGLSSRFDDLYKILLKKEIEK